MPGGLPGRPSTVIRSWSGSIEMPVGGGRTPFTGTEPEEMSSSAARRLATPDRARNLFSLSRGAGREPLGGSSAPMRPTPPAPKARGPQPVCAARSRIFDALAALLVASAGSGPPGSPSLSPNVPVRASAFEELRAVAWRREVVERLDACHLQEAHRRAVELGLAWT